MKLSKILLVMTLMVISIPSWAVKANPKPFEITQSDGTRLTVRLNGDEYFHWYSTTDGVILSRQGNDFYVANIDENGNVRPTELLAHNLSVRPFEERNVAAKQNRASFFSEMTKTTQKARQSTSIKTTTNPSYFPHEGSPTAIVILAQYADTTFTVSDPVTCFEQFLNGDEQVDYGHGENRNYGSVRQYFKDMSFGAFTPNFKIVGPVTLSKEMKYYGANSGSTYDVNCIAMVKEACTLASELIDFSDSEYDSDGDGYIDLVYVIYAGYGESNGADDNTIWPKSGVASIGTFGGKTVSRYGVNNELNANPYVTKGFFSTPRINGIGLFCHEFSHCLGLPDIYPTVASAQINNQAMEYWDLMDGGEYTGYGYYPTAYTAWEREVMGWCSITELSEDDETITTKTIDNGGTAYKMVNPSDANEYFVFENIQKEGWNSYALGHGLIAYHVKWPTTGVSFNQHANNTAGKPALALIPADSLLISSYSVDNGTYTTKEYENSHAGDPFPSTSNVSKLTYEQLLPNFKWYTEGPTVNQSLSNITEDTDEMTVTFSYNHNNTDGISDPTTINKHLQSDGVYTIDGIYLGTTLPATSKGVFVINGKKILKNIR